MRSGVARSLILVFGAFVFSAHVGAGQIPPYGGSLEYVRDLAARRERVMQRAGPNTVVVLWSAPTRVYSTDTDYEYRQESNLLYLTGIDQPQTTLVLVSTASVRRAFLFTRAGDAIRELWYGHVLTPAEATEQSGIADVYTQQRTEAFDRFIDGLLGGAAPAPAGLESVARLAKEGNLRLGIVDRIVEAKPGAEPAEPTEAVRWVRSMQRAHSGVSVTSVGGVFDSLRSIKTAYEQNVLRRSVEISAEAHIEGMKATRPGRWEYEVEAAVEYWFLKNGALSWGYPSIVGSGPNATTLHYLKSNRRMEAGDLLLVDAAANFQGLTGDITRTYPVSGTFSTAQREIYDVVLRAQEAGIAAARPDGRVPDISRAVRASIGAGLLKLGLVSDPRAATGEGTEIDLWYPHDPVHGIGMDVHDALGTLSPGAAFVIEPGLYIRSDTFERLAARDETKALAQRIEPAVRRYLNMGVRVEDSFLMTDAGPLMLSAKAPRLPQAIEAVVGTGR